MRIVAGTAGGRRLRAPDGSRTRPTSDRVREAVFSSLASLAVLDGSTVVDLFAGSGALGLEALSRGATAATFVERDRVALDIIRANVAELGFAGPGVRVVPGDALAAAATCGTADLVFADPPYAFSDWSSVTSALVSDGFGGLGVFETDSPLELADPWETVRARRYGGTVVTIARCRIPGDGPPPRDRPEQREAELE